MAFTPSESSLVTPIASKHDAMVADLTHVVGIPTGTRHHVGLDTCREWFRARLEAIGATCSELPGTPAPEWLREGDRGSENKQWTRVERVPPVLVATFNHSAPKLRLLLCGHIDTVHDPAESFNKLIISADGKTAIGPGCADMKGGLLVALEAIAAITRAGLPVSWTFAMNSDEESGSFHSDQPLRDIASRGFDYGLVFEPAMPDGGLVVERPASSQFMIECRGKAAHVGRDFTSGISAVTALSHAVLEASKIADPANGLIVSVGPLEGGSATNIVPDLARAWGNVRAFTPAAEALAAEKLRAVETKSLVLPTTKINYILSRPAKPQTPEVAKLASLAQRCSEDLRAIGRGVAMPLGKTGGVCDGNNLQAVGLPVIDTLGVRGGGLHTTSEWIDLESLTQRAQLAALLISRLAQQ